MAKGMYQFVQCFLRCASLSGLCRVLKRLNSNVHQLPVFLLVQRPISVRQKLVDSHRQCCNQWGSHALYCVLQKPAEPTASPDSALVDTPPAAVEGESSCPETCDTVSHGFKVSILICDSGLLLDLRHIRNGAHFKSQKLLQTLC